MYLGVWGEAQTERVIEKSRFLGYCRRVTGEEDARAYLSSLRALHPAATHVCYGFIADSLGNFQRFSDDGEPQGTAGMPILGVLKAQNLCESLVAVVRYFGGIKLGAGGLTRAYAGVAADAVAACEKRSFEECVELCVALSYSEEGTLRRFLSERGFSVLKAEYDAKARFTFAVRKSSAEEVQAALSDRFCGKAEITLGAQYLAPFPLK